MTIKVYDEDVTASDLVGESTIKLSSLCIGTGIDEWFPIQYKGKQSGTVHLKSTWRPGVSAGGNKAVGQANMMTAQMGYGMQPSYAMGGGASAMAQMQQAAMYQQQQQMIYQQQQMQQAAMYQQQQQMAMMQQ